MIVLICVNVLLENVEWRETLKSISSEHQNQQFQHHQQKTATKRDKHVHVTYTNIRKHVHKK